MDTIHTEVDQEMAPDYRGELTPLENEAEVDHQLLLLIQNRTRNNPITSAELGDRLNLTWTDVWTAIERLWEQGETVCTVGFGFWYTETDARDIMDSAAYQHGQARAFLEVAAAFERLASQMKSDR